jgi:electron transfer flavoprotein-quinone oxidoreductase
VLGLPRHQLEARFGLRDREGADCEIIGCTGDVPGGGFLYTNLDSVAVGVVLRLPELGRSGRRPEEIIADLKAHPSIAPLVEGGELKEYSAHLIPEGGWAMMPRLVADGMLVAGDAAAMCLAAGLWLEGVNFAIGAGAAAGEAAAEAVRAGDASAAGLAGYRRRLEAGFVLADHRKLRRAAHLILGPRTQQVYPRVLCDVAEGLFTVENPRPKRGLLTLARHETARAGVRLRDLVGDGWDALRTFG